jgi:hypothetical protein
MSIQRKRKLTGVIGVFLWVIATVGLGAQWIKVALEVKPDREIQEIFDRSSEGYTVQEYQDALNSECERQFNQNQDLIAGIDPDYYDFELNGTVRISNQVKVSNGYYFLLHADYLRIEPFNERYPSVLFRDVKSSDHPDNGYSFSKRFTTALQRALDDFVFMMNEYGVFDFNWNPLWGSPIPLDPGGYENKSIDEIKTLLGDMEKRLMLTIKSEIKAGIGGISPVVVLDPALKKEMVKLKDEIKKIREILGNMTDTDYTGSKAIAAGLDKIAKKVNEISGKTDNLVALNKNYIIIKIVKVKPPTGEPKSFNGIVIKPAGHTEMGLKDIKVNYIKEIATQSWINKRLAAKNSVYNLPEIMEGTMEHDNGTVTIILPDSQYNKILEMNNRSKVLEGIVNYSYPAPKIFLMRK